MSVNTNYELSKKEMSSISNDTNPKILFINPCSDYYPAEKTFSKKTVGVPYGILVLSSYIQSKISNCECKILNLEFCNSFDNSKEVLKSTLNEFKPSIVGLSLTYFYNVKSINLHSAH
jgi:hypothetical protein